MRDIAPKFRWYRGGEIRWRKHEAEQNDSRSDSWRAILESTSPPKEGYEPMIDCPDLFRQFSRLSTSDPGDLLGFAREFGRLRPSHLDPVVSSPGRASGDHVAQQPETLREWKVNVLALRSCLEVWDRLQTKGQNRLSKHFHFVPAKHPGWRRFARSDVIFSLKSLGKIARLNPHMYQPLGESAEWAGLDDDIENENYIRVIAASTFDADVANRFEETKDSIEMGNRLLILELNEHLQGHVSPWFYYDPKSHKGKLDLFPNSLLGAIWLQFANEYSGASRCRICEGCKKPFLVVSGKLRSDAKYCREACKSEAYRQRHGLVGSKSRRKRSAKNQT